MSKFREPISVRTTRINNLILGHSNATSKTSKLVADGLSRDGLLDALCLLYNECNKEQLKKRDKHIFEFISKYRPIIRETKSLRVNVDDFNVRALIGKGYFGDVHLVHEKATADVYALKKIRKSGITSSQVKEERDIMARRESEWITSLQYAFQDNENLYLVMEYLPGGDLLSLMARNGAFDEDLAKFYLAELTLAINSLHCMGYVHRDIKPENILIDRFGHIKLADFGNAAALNKDGHVTSLSPVGTPDYIAPELLQTISSFKLSKSVHDVTCDYWSMGIIGYEMLCEVTPFHEDNVHETYSRILSHCDDQELQVLVYPADVQMTSKFKKLLEGLVTKPSRRLTYLEIIRHPFFEGVNWDNLRQMVPPIIPTVNGEDDTSNFEDVERVKNRRSTFVKTSTIGSLQSNDFSGQDLPYLGYGFVHEEHVEVEVKKSDDSLINKLDAKVKELQKTIKEQMNEIKKLQENMLMAERKVAQSDSMNKILQEAKEELNKMKDKLKEKTIELASSKTEIKTLKSSLKIEEEMRLKSDANISDVLTSTYQKWEKAKMISDQNYEKQIAEKKTEISNFVQKLHACENELLEKTEKCAHLQEKLENYKEMLKSVKEQSIADKLEFEKSKIELAEAYDVKVLELKGKLRLEKDSRSKLSDELKDIRCELDESICSTNSNRQAKLATERNIEDMKQKLNREIEENKNLRSKSAAAEKRKSELEKSCEHLRAEVERLKEAQQLKKTLEAVGELATSPYRTAYGSLTDLHSVEEQLRSDLVAAKESEDVLRKRAEQLEKTVAKLEEMITKFNDQPKSVGDLLEKQNEKLEDKLASVREQVVVERQTARTANLSLWKLEKQVEDLTQEKKLTLRRMELTEEKIKRAQNDKSDIERKWRESKEVISQRETRIEELRGEITCLKADLQKEHKMWEKAEQERMKERSEALDHLSNVHKLEEKLEEGKQRMTQVLTKLDSVTLENKRFVREINEERERNSTLSENLTGLQIKMKSTQDNYEMLKVACNITDSQLTEIEVMLDTEVKRNEANTKKIDELWRKIREKDDQIAKLKQNVNKVQADKGLEEARSKTLLDELDELKRNFEVVHKQLVSQQEQLISKTSCLFEAQEKIEVLCSDTSNLQTVNGNFERQLIILKEENARILTDLFIAKEEGNKLERELKEARQNITEQRHEIEQLNGTLSEQKNFYMQREVKSEATLAQHKKLIDYLQLKVEDLSTKKKKCLVDKIFGTGTKENISPNAVESSITYRTLQEELKREKDRNNQLKEQLQKEQLQKAQTRPEPPQHSTSENLPVKSAPVSAVPTTKSENNLDNPPDHHHHQQDSSVVKRTDETNTTRRRTYQTHRMELTLDNSPGDLPYTSCMVCHKQVLIGNSHWRCKLCNAVCHRKCRGGVTTSCEGYEIQQLVAESKGKDGVETISTTTNTSIDQNDDQLSEQIVGSDYFGELIFKSSEMSPPLEVNCLYQIGEQTILLGCKSGLYAYHVDTREVVHIAGIDSVNYIAVTTSLSKSILVGSNGESLYQCDLRHLQNRSQANACLKPKLETSVLDLPFANRTFNEKWHLVNISNDTESVMDAVAIAATSTRIVIMKYDLQHQRFKPVRALDTATAVSSILFTRHTAIVCSDKFFEIDLASYAAEEFLDMSDASLLHTRVCQPMAAFRISSQEFLLCFTEFGVFTDEYGCRSRPYDLNWEYTPTGFMYREPLLYISHFQLLQVLRVHRSYTNEAAAALQLSPGDDDDEQQSQAPTHLRTYLNLNMPTLLGECQQLSVFVSAVRRDTNEQEIYNVDGVKTLKAKTNVSMETLASLATCITLESGSCSTDTL